MLTLPSANTGRPDGAEGLPPQPTTTPQIAPHTSTPERVIAPPDSLAFDDVLCYRRRNRRFGRGAPGYGPLKSRLFGLHRQGWVDIGARRDDRLVARRTRPPKRAITISVTQNSGTATLSTSRASTRMRAR
jgi:hypothetical protein